MEQPNSSTESPAQDAMLVCDAAERVSPSLKIPTGEQVVAVPCRLRETTVLFRLNPAAPHLPPLKSTESVINTGTVDAATSHKVKNDLVDDDGASTASSLSLDVKGFLEARERPARAERCMARVVANIAKWKAHVKKQQELREESQTARLRQSTLEKRGWEEKETPPDQEDEAAVEEQMTRPTTPSDSLLAC